MGVHLGFWPVNEYDANGETVEGGWKERIWQTDTSFVRRKELLLQSVKFPSPHYKDLSAKIDISDIQVPGAPPQV